LARRRAADCAADLTPAPYRPVDALSRPARNEASNPTKTAPRPRPDTDRVSDQHYRWSPNAVPSWTHRGSSGCQGSIVGGLSSFADSSPALTYPLSKRADDEPPHRQALPCKRDQRAQSRKIDRSAFQKEARRERLHLRPPPSHQDPRGGGWGPHGGAGSCGALPVHSGTPFINGSTPSCPSPPRTRASVASPDPSRFPKGRRERRP